MAKFTDIGVMHVAVDTENNLIRFCAGDPEKDMFVWVPLDGGHIDSETLNDIVNALLKIRHTKNLIK